MGRARLVIAEDHEMVGQGLRAALEPEYDILALVRDGARVVEAIKTLHPDLLLLDLTLPNRSGLDILEELRTSPVRCRVLMVTMHVDQVLMETAFQAGADGFIPKDSGVAELRGAIEELLAGRRYASAKVPRQGHRGGCATPMGFLLLTPRQREIVRLIGRGMTSEQIAGVLGVSPHTVHFHRKNLRRLLGIRSDLEMYRYAILVGIEEEHEGHPARPL